MQITQVSVVSVCKHKSRPSLLLHCNLAARKIGKLFGAKCHKASGFDQAVIYLS